MPGVDGREVARTVKSISPQTRVLLLTGWADRLMVEGDFPVGVDQLLGKPITKAQLRQAIGAGPPNAETPSASSPTQSVPLITLQVQPFVTPTATGSQS
jgi:CheY-like chemotaxis protein